MTASSLSLRAAVVFAILGMTMGIAMAAAHDHSVMPAHAHLNLVGWVSLFLIGVYYRLNPSIDASRLALVQVVAWIVGTVILTIGVAAIHLGYTSAEPVAVVGSFIILAGIIVFAVLVFRPAAKESGAVQWAGGQAR